MAKKLQILGEFISDDSDAVKTINGVEPDEDGNVDVEVMTDAEVLELMAIIQ